MEQTNGQVIAALVKLVLAQTLSDAQIDTLVEFAARSAGRQALVDMVMLSNPKAVQRMLRPALQRCRSVPTKAMWKEISAYISGGSTETIPLPKYKRLGTIRRVFSAAMRLCERITSVLKACPAQSRKTRDNHRSN